MQRKSISKKRTLRKTKRVSRKIKKSKKTMKGGGSNNSNSNNNNIIHFTSNPQQKVNSNRVKEFNRLYRKPMRGRITHAVSARNHEIRNTIRKKKSNISNTLSIE